MGGVSSETKRFTLLLPQNPRKKKKKSYLNKQIFLEAKLNPANFLYRPQAGERVGHGGGHADGAAQDGAEEGAVRLHLLLLTRPHAQPCRQVKYTSHTQSLVLV